jgi:beta-lactamase regulating signal transducer with metallopeptidase domain
MVVLILLSPLLLLFPKWPVTLSWQSSSTIYSSAWDISTLLSSYWIAGSLVTLAFYLTQAFQLRNWVRRMKHVHSGILYQELENASQQLGLNHPPKLRLSNEAHSPVVTGLFKPTIILPECALYWDRTTLHVVYLHELGHIQRKDLWISAVAQSNCILYWWNPLVWMLKLSLRHQCEFAVDAAIVAKGTDKKTYVSALCRVAEEIIKNRPLLGPTLSMAYQASLRNRVKSLTQSTAKLHPIILISLTAISISSSAAVAILEPATIAKTLGYTEEELESRFSASPFPGDQ